MEMGELNKGHYHTHNRYEILLNYPSKVPMVMQNNEFEKVKSSTEVNHEQALRAHELIHRMAAEARKAAIDTANVAVRSLILINGGAVVALLAFVSALKSGSNGSTINLEPLIAPILWFARGVGFSAITSVLAYLVNLMDSDFLAELQHTWDPPYVSQVRSGKCMGYFRNLLHFIALLLAILSLITFFCGVYGITGAISQFGT